MRLIDADEAIRISKEDKTTWVYDLTDLEEFLACVPTINPDSLVKRGRWMDCGDLAPMGARCKCSCCGGFETNFYRWCHNCGALMGD